MKQITEVAPTTVTTTATTNVKIDPLMRIQEEIKEVVRREQEYRQLTSTIMQNDNHDNDNNHNEQDGDNVRAVIEKINNHQSLLTTNNNIAPLSIISVQDNNSLSNTPSLSPSIASKDESLDETHHSDDSGISASSSPINGTSANVKKIINENNNKNKLQQATNKATRYIGPNCYNMTPKTPQERSMSRTVSTPHLAMSSKPRPINIGPAQKGVMQRFIASRGKIQLSKQGLGTPNGLNNNISNDTALSSSNVSSFLALDPTERSGKLTPAIVERDAEGRPIRRGYVPVELKIQRELKDLKSRERELKTIRKIRQSTPDLLNSIDNENVETDEDDEEVEHCYGPGQLRSAKSIGELCDSAQSNNSFSPRATPSPDFEHKFNRRNSSSNVMRPALSLAQLCDLDPQEAASCQSLQVSSLIAQFEQKIMSV